MGMGACSGVRFMDQEQGDLLSHRRLQAQPVLSCPPQPLHLVAPLWNAGTRGIRGLSSAAAPEGNQKKGRSLLQFLADRFYDVQALREYLFRKQAWKMHQKNR